MPSRNIYKEYVSESYYHIYNRGVNKESIFLDEQDYVVFLGLLKRYLSAEIEKTTRRTLYQNYYDEVELLAFCLMKNHFHLCIYQLNPDGISKIMKSVSVAYSMYFNKRYKRIGPVFQQRYRAVRITDDSQLLHISRYIHMNPQSYRTFKWSSLPYFTKQRTATWVRPDRLLSMFEGIDYLSFLKEYESRRDELEALKCDLANS